MNIESEDEDGEDDDELESLNNGFESYNNQQTTDLPAQDTYPPSYQQQPADMYVPPVLNSNLQRKVSCRLPKYITV